MKTIAAVVLTMALAVPTSAFGHEGGHRVYGSVKEITADRLVVSDEHGKDTVFVLSPGTRIFRDHKPTTWEKVKVGERVVVKGTDASGRMEATSVNLGAAPERGTAGAPG